jgi:2-keto-3-deoxy-L-rhamnonate aldolase RhmA
MRKNPLKQRLAAGETAYGTMVCEYTSPGMPATLVAAGAEFIMYDMEHTGIDFAELKRQFSYSRALGIVPMVRPIEKSYSAVTRLLDMGALGLMLQMTESAEEAAKLVSWTRYPPSGVRGCSFGQAHDDYAPGAMTDKIRVSNERVIVMPMIETRRGLDAVEEIVAVDGVDGVHLGQFDLSLSLGIAGQMDHPELQRGIDRIINACRKHGKFAACLGTDSSTTREWRQRGFRLISCNYDVGLLQSALVAFIREARTDG